MAVVSAQQAMDAMQVIAEEDLSAKARDAVIVLRLYLRQQRNQSQRIIPAWGTVAQHVGIVNEHAQAAMEAMAEAFPGHRPDPEKDGDGQG